MKRLLGELFLTLQTFQYAAYCLSFDEILDAVPVDCTIWFGSGADLC